MSACPDEIAFARALTEGADAEVLLHLADCAECRAAWNGQRAAIELARKLTVSAPRADKREELRTALLASPVPTRAAVGSRRRWLAVGGALAATAAAAAVLAIVVSRPSGPAAAHAHGTVTAAAGARYVVASTAPDEIVLLDDGVIDVEVTPLHPGERFRVITADGEIEVHGTAFAVESHMGRVSSVRVRHGVVDVRPVGGPAARLGAGDAWFAPTERTARVQVPPVIDVPPVRAGEPRASEPRADKPRADRRAAIGAAVARPDKAAPQALAAQADNPATTAAARSPQAVAYDAGWAAMRAGNFAAASSAFVRASILDPEGALAEDASYWYPVALARAKRAEATTAFRDFLDRYPRSAHAHEASAMLGWLLVDASQRAEAERRFRFALDDARPDVRASARAGLTALGVR